MTKKQGAAEHSGSTDCSADEPRDHYEFDDFDDVFGCLTCDGDGMVVVCCDDICRAQGWCFHGDGMAICPECKGECF